MRLRRQVRGEHRFRILSVLVVLVTALAAAAVRLVQVQGFQAEALSRNAAKQRTLRMDIPAARGDILDRAGRKLAFNVETKALSWSPKAMRAQYAKAGTDFDARTAEIAARVKAVLGDRVDEQDLLTRMRGTEFTYLAVDVDPAQEREITRRYKGEIAVETRVRREYPGGALASDILGHAKGSGGGPGRRSGDVHGQSGLEAARDNVLAGKAGSVTVDTGQGADDLAIPGTERDLRPARDGASLELTLDADVQYHAQRALAAYVARSGARGGAIAVLDARTGEILALTGDRSADLTGPSPPHAPVNPAVGTAFEPGAVHSVVTAAAAIEFGVIAPDNPVEVPGSLQLTDRVLRDSWHSGRVMLSATGVFAKASDVGTTLLAQRVGPDRYAMTLAGLGLGERTGTGLPGENPGFLPPRGQWSSVTFDDLPTGRGVSMTVLQLAGVYQTIANDGVRVPPRIVRAVIDSDGTRRAEPRPPTVRVVSDRTAAAVREVLRAATQQAPGGQAGAVPTAGVLGHQVAAMTGVVAPADPAGAGGHWTTFAGMLPAEDPRFVVAIMLDAPDHGRDEGRSAGPLFHDVASYLVQRSALPLSVRQAPVVPLVLPG